MRSAFSTPFAALAALSVVFFSTCAHAQSSDLGPLATPAGKLQFVRADRDFVGMLDTQTFDRFSANALTHFDDIDTANDSVEQMLVQTDSGPVLYDFRRRPALVQRFGTRLSIRRVFWQSDEIVLQSAQGWFRFKRGVLEKLQSSRTIYH